ncbi:MAG TPA: hypothetical protein VGK02_07630 [Candidatus Aquicultor sp.]|jgi:hypothetical protein
MRRLDDTTKVDLVLWLICVLFLAFALAAATSPREARGAVIPALSMSGKPAASGLEQATGKIGVVFSYQTEESGKQKTHPGSNMGQVAVIERETIVYNMLEKRGYDVVKVSDSDLKSLATLQQYPVVVFPWMFMMDEAQGATVRDYVGQGGSAVMLFDISRVYPPFGLYIRYFAHDAWEWGPISELLQIRFINDPFDSGFTVSSRTSTHPIINATKSTLDDSSITLVEPQAAGVVYTQALPGTVNKNVAPVMWYSNGTPALWAGQYGKGKLVYFTFKVMDFWWHSRLASYADTAKELASQSINWAAVSDGSAVRTDFSAAATGKVGFTSKGLLIRHYLKSTGNIQAMGDVTTAVYAANGKLIYSTKRQRAGSMPGATPYWSFPVKVAVKKGVKYRVVITYQDRYKRYSHREEATIAYGQGQVATKAVR